MTDDSNMLSLVHCFYLRNEAGVGVGAAIFCGCTTAVRHARPTLCSLPHFGITRPADIVTPHSYSNTVQTSSGSSGSRAL